VTGRWYCASSRSRIPLALVPPLAAAASKHGRDGYSRCGVRPGISSEVVASASPSTRARGSAAGRFVTIVSVPFGPMVNQAARGLPTGRTSR
jgi:hypothetical protein